MGLVLYLAYIVTVCGKLALTAGGWLLAKLLDKVAEKFMSYYRRIALIVIGLALAAGALVALLSRGEEIQVVAQSPVGSGVALDAPITISFSRPVDRRSAEASFTLVPPVAGRLSWQGETLVFTPSAPLAPATIYRAIIQPGLRDRLGRANRGETGWSFRTR
jgi:hypothetical protein